MMTSLVITLVLVFLAVGLYLVRRGRQSKPTNAPGALRAHFFTKGGQKFARVGSTLYMVRHSGWVKLEGDL